MDDKSTQVVLNDHSHSPAAKNLKAVFVPRNFGSGNPVEINCELSLKRKYTTTFVIYELILSRI